MASRRKYLIICTHSFSPLHLERVKQSDPIVKWNRAFDALNLFSIIARSSSRPHFVEIFHHYSRLGAFS